jgi:hypothetical protein
LTDILKREHQAIAAFAASRVFPALDEFTSAHRLTISVESGLLVLLAQRLVYQGFGPADILTTVQQAMDAMASKSPAAVSPAKPLQDTNVVSLRPTKK